MLPFSHVRISGHSVTSSWKIIQRLGESCYLTHPGWFYALTPGLCRSLRPWSRAGCPSDSQGGAAESISLDRRCKRWNQPKQSILISQNTYDFLWSQLRLQEIWYFFLKQNFHKFYF